MDQSHWDHVGDFKIIWLIDLGDSSQWQKRMWTGGSGGDTQSHWQALGKPRSELDLVKDYHHILPNQETVYMGNRTHFPDTRGVYTRLWEALWRSIRKTSTLHPCIGLLLYWHIVLIEWPRRFTYPSILFTKIKKGSVYTHTLYPWNMANNTYVVRKTQNNYKIKRMRKGHINREEL
jgi:hypothetical protein